MKHRPAISPAILIALAGPVCAYTAWTRDARADEARIHVAAGAAHAVGPPQQREFGPGGGGSATIELPVGDLLGVQASGGGLVLTAGSAPADPTLAAQSTGSAFIGTVGVRVHPLGKTRVAGPWLDANGGLAQTGSQGRVAFDAHVGWDFRVSDKARWDVGPFVGFTQIVQSDTSLRPDDARIVWAGIAVSLGARDRSKPVVAPTRGRIQAPPHDDDHDGVAEASDVCPSPDDLDAAVPDGCPTPDVKLVGDRIVIDDVIHFEFNSPLIRRQSTGLVKRVAHFILQTPDILEVSIEGHADARGSDEYNQQLSEARAASTRAMLVGFGVDESRLRVVGFGKSRLKVATSDPDERNRRVELIVSRDARSAGPPPAPPQSPPSSPSSAPVVSSGTRGRP